MRRPIALFAIAAMACKEAPQAPEEILPLACQPVTQVVAKSSSVLLLGRATPLAATAYREAGGGGGLNAPTIIDVPIAWRSMDPGVVTVNTAGIATPVAVGATRLIASACRIADTATVSVIAKPYTVTSVSLGADIATTGVALNDSGALVATSSQSGALANFLWKEGAATDLGGCIPKDVNNLGQVLCSAFGPTIWENGSATARDTFRVAGGALNDSGHVRIGRGAFPPNIVWRGPANFVSFQMGFAEPSTGLNNLDDVIGMPSGVLYAKSYVLRHGGQSPQILGFGRSVRALALNDSADVVGNSEYMSFIGRFDYIAFLARRSNNYQEEKLRPDARVVIPNDIAETAIDINNQRQIIGSGSQGPFIWSDGKLGLLNQLVSDQTWTITSVTRINNRGQILAQARNSSDGIARAVLIDPS